VNPNAALICAIVAAMGGAGSFGATYRGVDQINEKVADLRQDVKDLKSSFGEIHELDRRITRLETLLIRAKDTTP
jgi:hypothetical protein